MKNIMQHTISGKHLILICLFFLTLLFACDDIFEKDLSSEKVVLIAPGDSIQTQFSTQTFYWEELKGASSYNLQVVTPSFKHIEQFIADTTVTGTNFMLNLTPGYSYEWRVIGKNGSSKTDSCTIWLVQIDSTGDLQNQRVELKTPDGGFITKDKKITFTWKPLPNATGYYFLIGLSDLSKVKGIEITSTSITIDTLSNGNFNWGVKAFNNTTTTGRWNTRTILIDTIKPTKPILSEPSDKKNVTDKKVKFFWSQPTDKGSSLSYTVYISNDSVAIASLDLNKIELKLKVDTIGLYNTFTKNDTYFWRVRTSDAAGNLSDPSDFRKFSITP